MGGKHKAQRTKNNVRPSSSGRSAELLGTKVSTFVGFSAIKDGGYVPALPGCSEEIDSNINPNFHLVLKKMNKKDSTTKLKALNEFGSLCRESDPAAVKTVLPFWPRLYCVLATDAEHRVREAAHNAHRAVVSSVGRSIAPYLKQIAGAWFTSQYDTYPPAASAASSSFQDAFSPNKLTEAIIFCQEEIINYITDNLINQTPQSLSSTKTASPEEMEAKYQRVIVSSLHGYGFYLSKLPDEQLQKAEDLNKKLIENPKFWKFSKHSANIVRVAWFTAIVNLCQKAPFFLSNVKKQVVSTVFNSLDDRDSVVLPIVWEAALHVVDKIEGWRELVSAEKLLFPKLWKILKEGGLGCAASIFPNMLPFLSKIPSDLISDKLMFYSRYFSSLEDGIRQRNVQLSVIESEAVAECYMECFSYIILTHIESVELCGHLVSEQLLTVLELTLKDQKLHLLRRPFFNKLISSLILWSKQQKSPEVFSKLVRDVFNDSVVICSKIIDYCIFDRKQIEVILNAQADLICAFKYHQGRKQRKRLKVTFSEEKSPLAEESCTENKNLETFFEQTPKSFQFEANNFVKKITAKYFDCLSSVENSKSFFVSQLAKVIAVFDSNEMFVHLLTFCGSENRSWSEFYTKYISNWLSDEQISVENVSQLIFTLLKYVQSEDEKQFALNSLSQTETKKVLEWCLKNENINFISVKNWLASDKMDSIIISVVEEAITISDGDTNNAYCLVKSCLKRTDDGSILIKFQTVVSIVKYLCEIIRNYQKSKQVFNFDNIAGLIDSCLLVYLEHVDEKYEQDIIDIVLESFKLCLEEITSPALDRSWQNCVARLVPFKKFDGSLIGKLTVGCSGAVKSFIYLRSYLTVHEINHIVRQCIKYLISIEKSGDCDVAEEFIDTLLKDILFQNENQELVNYMLKLCYCAEVMGGKLCLPVIQEVPDEIISCSFSDLFSDDLMKKFVTPSLFAVLFLLRITGFDESFYIDNKMVVNKSDDDSDDAGEHDLDGCKLSCVNDFSLTNFTLNNYTAYLADSVLKLAAVRIFRRNFCNSRQFLECTDKINILEKLTKELIQKLHYDESKNVERELIQRGFDSITGGICAEAVHFLHCDLLDTENPASTLNSILEENKLVHSQSDILCLWLPQVFSSGTDFSDSNLGQLCSLLWNQNQVEDSALKTVITNRLDSIFRLGKLPTFDTDLLSCCSKDTQFSSDVAELLFVLVEKHPALVTEHNGWDFTMIAVASWISNLKNVTSSDPESFCSLPVLHLLSSVCRLFKSLSNYISSMDDGCQLKTEWNDVFRSDVHTTLVNIWTDITDNFQEGPVRPLLLIIFHELGTVVDEIIDVNTFINKSNLSYWLEICCHRLLSSYTEIQLTAFKLLIEVTPHLVASDSECDGEDRGKDVDVSFKHIEHSLKHLQNIVDTMLSAFKLGDTCIVEPFTDGYIYSRSYLLLWLFILEICDKADSQLRFMYTAWIKENGFLEYLMKSLFCLMPEEAVHGLEGNIKHVQELFSNPPEFSAGFWESKTLAHLSCWTYYKLLTRLPAVVRQWWSEIDHKVATIVERLTTMFVSPLVCMNEMKAVRQKGKNFQNMTVHIHPAAREVVAVYVVEESRTELVIQLPLNHPLGPTKVECGKCMVSTNQTRQWVMQLSLFLIHQNGSIWDALSLWKTLIDKKFEGVEECYICFAILHNTTQQLPRLSCQTCKKKFHNTCLYQWFTTSNKSTCPICRNLF